MDRPSLVRHAERESATLGELGLRRRGDREVLTCCKVSWPSDRTPAMVRRPRRLDSRRPLQHGLSSLGMAHCPVQRSIRLCRCTSARAELHPTTRWWFGSAARRDHGNRPNGAGSWLAFGVSKEISVVGAVIVQGGRVLCARRGPGGRLAEYWEFPGGKIEAGETPQEALSREIHEELECVVTVGGPVTTTTYQYEFATITLSTFFCDLVSGVPVATEHAELRWVSIADLEQLEWAPADIPAVAEIKARLAA